MKDNIEILELTIEQVQAITLRAQGRKWTEICERLDISQKRLYEWRKGNETFQRELARYEEEAKENAIALAKVASEEMLSYGYRNIRELSEARIRLPPDDARKYVVDGVKMTRLTHNMSTENVAKRIQTEPATPVTENEKKEIMDYFDNEE